MLRIFLLCCISVTSFAAVNAQIIDGESSLYELVLVQADLQDATKALTVHDLNEDGFIDRDEQKKLRWRDSVDDFDMDRDGKLTHLELAIRYAKLRTDLGIEQSDVNNANIYLRRHDKNRNGQLDPEEIANGWPDEPEEFDKNNDGIITLGEMAARFAFMKGLRRAMGIEQVDQVTAIRMVRSRDRDGDKKLDADERENAALPLPADDFDEDDDSKLGIMEIATMLATNRRKTGLSKSDLAQIRSLFERLDPDADGVIQLTEVAVFAGQQNELNQFDVNEDGKVTRAEVQRLYTERRREAGFNDDQLAEAKKLMARHDTNRNTYIDAGELFKQPKTGQLPERLMKTADENKDQRLSLEELARHLARTSK